MNKFFALALVAASCSLVSAASTEDSLEIANLDSDTIPFKDFCYSARDLMLNELKSRGSSASNDVFTSILDSSASVRPDSAEIGSLLSKTVENSEDTKSFMISLASVANKFIDIKNKTGDSSILKEVCGTAATFEELMNTELEQYKNQHPRGFLFSLRDIRCRSSNRIAGINGLCDTILNNDEVLKMLIEGPYQMG